MKCVKRDDERKTVAWEFDGLEDFLRAADKGSFCVSHGADGFSNHASWNDCLQFLKTGWSEGYAEVVKSFRGIAKADQYLEEETMETAMSGPLFDIGAVIEGNPEAYLDFSEEDSHRPVVKIGCQIGAQGYFEQKQFYNRGAVALALVSTLEKAGMAVELWGFGLMGRGAGGHGNRDWFRWDIPLKRSHEPLDTDKLAFILSHAGFYRKLGFGMEYGISRESYNHTPDNCGTFDIAILGKGAHVFDAVTPYGSSLGDIEYLKRWLSETCLKFGVTVEF